MSDYDKYYKTEELFGEPYPELIDFFAKYSEKGRVLDLGCGQGRDSIALARLGYLVTGIDSSRLGIDQMTAISDKEGLGVIGVVTDIFLFDSFHEFDIVLLDSMLHFEKRDRELEIRLIENIAKLLRQNGLLCICIQDTGKKVKILKETIDNTGLDFEVMNDSALLYKFEDKESGDIFETKYRMYVVKKK